MAKVADPLAKVIQGVATAAVIGVGVMLFTLNDKVAEIAVSLAVMETKIAIIADEIKELKETR